jgi:hypothetical protein
MITCPHCNKPTTIIETKTNVITKRTICGFDPCGSTFYYDGDYEFATKGKIEYKCEKCHSILATSKSKLADKLRDSLKEYPCVLPFCRCRYKNGNMCIDMKNIPFRDRIPCKTIPDLKEQLNNAILTGKLNELRDSDEIDVIKEKIVQFEDYSDEEKEMMIKDSELFNVNFIGRIDE